ncbi:hypothetical protein HK102_002617, partial [Quaeritorhiza haematococci]
MSTVSVTPSTSRSSSAPAPVVNDNDRDAVPGDVEFEEGGGTFDVLLSYHQNVQPHVIAKRDALESRGLAVYMWMDIDQME